MKKGAKKNLLVNDSSGFTLIEVMLALVIFAVGLLAVAYMQISAIRGNDTAFEFSKALTLAQSKIDKLTALPYDDTMLDDDDGDGTNQDSDDDGLDDSGNNFGLDDNTTATADGSETIDSKYSLFWNIAVDEPVNNAKKIRIIVQWQDGSTQRQAELDTVKMQ